MSKEMKERMILGHARITKALRAMKARGISPEKAMPVLTNLLELYQKWTPIEAENYRALADAIMDRDKLEAQERSKKTVINEAAEQSKKTVNTQAQERSKKTVINEAAEQSKKTVNTQEEEAHVTKEPDQPPLKRSRLRYQNDQTPSNTSNQNAESLKSELKKAKDELLREKHSREGAHSNLAALREHVTELHVTIAALRDELKCLPEKVRQEYRASAGYLRIRDVMYVIAFEHIIRKIGEARPEWDIGFLKEVLKKFKDEHPLPPSRAVPR